MASMGKKGVFFLHASSLSLLLCMSLTFFLPFFLSPLFYLPFFPTGSLSLFLVFLSLAFSCLSVDFALNLAFFRDRIMLV